MLFTYAWTCGFVSSINSPEVQKRRPIKQKPICTKATTQVNSVCPFSLGRQMSTSEKLEVNKHIKYALAPYP